MFSPETSGFDQWILDFECLMVHLKWIYNSYTLSKYSPNESTKKTGGHHSVMASPRRPSRRRKMGSLKEHRCEITTIWRIICGICSQQWWVINGFAWQSGTAYLRNYRDFIDEPVDLRFVWSCFPTCSCSRFLGSLYWVTRLPGLKDL